MNSRQVFHNFDKVVDRGLLEVAAAVLYLHLLGDLQHLLPAEVQKGLDKVTVHKALKKQIKIATNKKLL